MKRIIFIFMVIVYLSCYKVTNAPDPYNPSDDFIRITAKVQKWEADTAFGRCLGVSTLLYVRNEGTIEAPYFEIHIKIRLDNNAILKDWTYGYDMPPQHYTYLTLYTPTPSNTCPDSIWIDRISWQE